MSKQAPDYELATILQHHKDHLSTIVPNAWKYRCLFAIARCRTAEMGGHIDKCNDESCGKLHISYNSCRNRHCPKCQGHLAKKWIEQREAGLLNTNYFHVVFTLPDTLNELALEKAALLYNTLFKVAWSVIKDFGNNRKFLGAKTGMIALLHTWGQNLSLHPHLHCIVPAGGMTKSGKWKASGSKGRFLFPVKAMTKVFRARFVEELRKHTELPQSLSKKLFDKDWIIFAKRPFHGPKQVIKYLGRYTHKIAISNHRIMDIVDGEVYFSAKNYRQGGKKRVLVLQETELIRRFALHILPRGFTRIRHYGILGSSCKQKYKILIDKQIGKVTPTKKPDIVVHKVCPACKKGQLETVATFDSRGPPDYWLSKLG